MIIEFSEADDSRVRWNSGGEWKSADIDELITAYDRNLGKWGYAIVRQYPIGYNLAKCSRCGWTHHSRPGEKGILTAEDVATYFKYCPHCGAKMEVKNLLESE